MIFDIFLNPRNYFLKLKEKPIFIIPLIIILVFTLIQSYTAIRYTNISEVIKRMEERGAPREQIERAEEFMRRPARIIIGLVSALIFTLLFLLIISLIFNFSLPLLGSEGNFSKTFAIVCGSSLVTALGSLIRSIIIIIRQSPFVNTSLALFLPTEKGLLFSFLSRFDFFTIWQIILIAFGLKIVFDIKGNKSYYFVIGLWLLWVIISTFLFRSPGAFRSSMRG
ncbi:MAG: YIP1 family protein [candidate division WOR-3 bacterium]|nr:YIP1 family protein [candidate division WOR-3 bacterium]MCX7837160.1 YIP1 family protein [candidate division WOR-3 bacterium]MDW8114183.1 YIP1 family protein [candidate division WOR-3 bacterium]